MRTTNEANVRTGSVDPSHWINPHPNDEGFAGLQRHSDVTTKTRSWTRAMTNMPLKSSRYPLKLLLNQECLHDAVELNVSSNARGSASFPPRTTPLKEFFPTSNATRLYHLQPWGQPHSQPILVDTHLFLSLSSHVVTALTILLTETLFTFLIVRDEFHPQSINRLQIALPFRRRYEVKGASRFYSQRDNRSKTIQRSPWSGIVSQVL